MPYASVDDLPPSFKNLPTEAKQIAMATMNSVLRGKTETPELVISALQAAWAQIKRRFERAASGTWVAKSGRGYSFGTFHFAE